LIHNDAVGYDPSAHEEPPDLQAGISIRSLTKIYNQVSLGERSTTYLHGSGLNVWPWVSVHFHSPP